MTLSMFLSYAAGFGCFSMLLCFAIESALRKRKPKAWKPTSAPNDLPPRLVAENRPSYTRPLRGGDALSDGFWDQGQRRAFRVSQLLSKQ